jgi:hypothetical protein
MMLSCNVTSGQTICHFGQVSTLRANMTGKWQAMLCHTKGIRGAQLGCHSGLIQQANPTITRNIPIQGVLPIFDSKEPGYLHQGVGPWWPILPGLWPLGSPCLGCLV